jgi:hypothetical protein
MCRSWDTTSGHPGSGVGGLDLGSKTADSGVWGVEWGQYMPYLQIRANIRCAHIATVEGMPDIMHVQIMACHHLQGWISGPNRPDLGSIWGCSGGSSRGSRLGGPDWGSRFGGPKWGPKMTSKTAKYDIFVILCILCILGLSLRGSSTPPSGHRDPFWGYLGCHLGPI